MIDCHYEPVKIFCIYPTVTWIHKHRGLFVLDILIRLHGTTTFLNSICLIHMRIITFIVHPPFRIVPLHYASTYTSLHWVDFISGTHLRNINQFPD